MDSVLKAPAALLDLASKASLKSVKLPDLSSYNLQMPPFSSLKTDEAKLVAAAALGTGTVYLMMRRPNNGTRTPNPSRVVEITTLEDLQQYHTGGLLRDVAAWLITPAVTAVRVTGHGDRIPSLPRALCNLSALKELKVSDNAITELPHDIGRLVHLETLDVSGNLLRFLPDTLGGLTALTSLNAMGNELEELPASLGSLKSLRRLGLKGNKLRSLPSSIGALDQLQELFLTDNCLEELPEEISGCTALVKLQASHNALRALPDALGALPRLELLRVACSEVADIPSSLATARSLAWLSLATNPVCRLPSPRRPSVPTIAVSDLEVGRKLGDGASGEVFEAHWKGRRTAFKIFRSELSPDGHSRDEIAVACALADKNLVRVLARVEEPLGLVMEFVEGAPLAEKPTSESLLRCRWAPGTVFDLEYLLRAASGVASALEHMHSRGVAHGDVYAHNVMADEDGTAVLCDYGASFFYPKGGVMAAAFEGQDTRAFGLMLRDMVQRLDIDFFGMETALDVQKQLLLLVQQCTTGPPAERPRFGAVARKLKTLEKAAVASASAGATPRSDSRLQVKSVKLNGLARDGLATAR